MKSLLLKLFNFIAKSAKTNSEVSSIRIQAYLLLISIIFMSFTFLIIEIADFVVAYKNGIDYQISSEIIIIFGMLLSHHVGVALTRKNANVIDPSAFLVAKENNKKPGAPIDNTIKTPAPITDTTMITKTQQDEYVHEEN